MKYFLFIFIFLIITNLKSQNNFGLFDKNLNYTLSNKEFLININISEFNKKLLLKSNFCPECTDNSYNIIPTKKIKKDIYFFEIENFMFILDLTTKYPIINIINSYSNNIKDPILISN